MRKNPLKQINCGDKTKLEPNLSFATCCSSVMCEIQEHNYVTEIHQHDYRNSIIKRKQTSSVVFSFSNNAIIEFQIVVLK